MVIGYVQSLQALDFLLRVKVCILYFNQTLYILN